MMKTLYDSSGQETTEDYVAEHIHSGAGDTYKILYMGNSIFHPVEHKRPRQHEIKKFRSVSKEIFDGYLSFLQGGEERKYRAISRII